MKKQYYIFNILLIMLLLLGFVLSLLWYINGSLEMIPSAEQEGKAKIVSLGFVLLFGGASLSSVFYLIRKRKKNTK